MVDIDYWLDYDRRIYILDVINIFNVIICTGNSAIIINKNFSLISLLRDRTLIAVLSRVERPRVVGLRSPWTGYKQHQQQWRHTSTAESGWRQHARTADHWHSLLMSSFTWHLIWDISNMMSSAVCSHVNHLSSVSTWSNHAPSPSHCSVLNARRRARTFTPLYMKTWQ